MRKYIFGIILVTILVLLNNHFYFFALNVIEPSDEGSFRIMTYNTNGVSGDYKDTVFVNDFLDKLDSIHPHVLVLQEMRVPYSSILCDELQNKYPYNSLSVLSNRKYEDRKVACLFSLYPIKSFFRLAYNEEKIDSIYDANMVPDSIRRPSHADIYNAVLNIDNRETLVIGCYMKTNNYSKHRLEHPESWLDGLDDYFNGYDLGSAIRTLGAKMIRDSIAKYNLPTIVCGDMNDFQFSTAVKTIMDDDLKNVWWERGFGYGMTYDNYHLKIRIDHILISKEFDVASVTVPHLRFSDHYPIVADLKFVDE